MDRRRAAIDELLAQPGDDVCAEFADRIGIVAERLEALGDPARDLGAAHVREAAQLRILRDRHDAGHDRHRDAELARVIDETEVRVGVVEVLRDCAIGTGIDLGDEMLQVRLCVAGLDRKSVV